MLLPLIRPLIKVNTVDTQNLKGLEKLKVKPVPDMAVLRCESYPPADSQLNGFHRRIVVTGASSSLLPPCRG